MSEQRDSNNAFFWLIVMSLVMLMGVLLLPLNAQAQGRGKAGKKIKKSNVANVQSASFKGIPISLTGTCSGTIGEFQDKEGISGNVTLGFMGDTFTITKEGGSPEGGKLSAIARSKRNGYLYSMSVNFTFDNPPPPPIFSLSLRGCYGSSEDGCESPRLGGAARGKQLRLYGVGQRRGPDGEPRKFSFESSSCENLQGVPLTQ